MKRNWLYVLVIIAVTLSVAGGLPAQKAMAAPIGNGVPILYYDFENNTTRTTFENLVEQAINSGSAAITRAGNSTAITNVGGAGTFNGGAATGQAATGSNWDSATTDPGNAATNYYQFIVNTTGFSQIVVSFDNQASGTGPARVGVLYSTDGSTFTATSVAATGNAAWATASFDLASVLALDNQSSVTIRLYAYAGDRTGRSAFGTGGTFRVDNLTVFAKTITASRILLNYPAIGLSIKSGTTFTPVYTDTIINGAGVIATLASNLNLAGTLTVNSGSSLVIPSGSTLTVTTLINNGTIVQTQSVPASGAVNFANTGSYGGVSIDANGTALGITEVVIKDAPGTTCVTGGQSVVGRCFQITPGNGTSGYNATVTFSFSTTDLNGEDCNSLLAYHYDDGGIWTALTEGASHTYTRQCTTSPYSVQVTGVTDFSPFVLADGVSAPSAVTLNDLSASATTASPAPIAFGLMGLTAAALLLRRRLVRAASN